jgi:hypothetical protein
MKTCVNGFNYDEEEKKIVIKDDEFTVIYANVGKDDAKEAMTLFEKKNDNNISTLLQKNGSKRFWVQGESHK